MKTKLWFKSHHIIAAIFFCCNLFKDIHSPWCLKWAWRTQQIIPALHIYLHSSNNSRSVLVLHSLIGENHSTWWRAMRMALSVKNKLGFVNGTINKPSSPPSTIMVWECCNDMVLSWLLNSFAPEIANCVTYADTT